MNYWYDQNPMKRRGTMDEYRKSNSVWTLQEYKCNLTLNIGWNRSISSLIPGSFYRRYVSSASWSSWFRPTEPNWRTVWFLDLAPKYSASKQKLIHLIPRNFLNSIIKVMEFFTKHNLKLFDWLFSDLTCFAAPLRVNWYILILGRQLGGSREPKHMPKFLGGWP